MADPKDQPVDFDDLLSLVNEEPETAPTQAPEPAQDSQPVAVPAPIEDEEDARIAALKAALAAPMPEVHVQDAPLTPKQREIQELEDQLARRNAIIAENSPLEYVTPTGNGETIVIHVVQDGFIALGEVWFRGQELEFEIGSAAHRATFNTLGISWVDIAGDLQAQYKRWGKQYLAVGPFIPRPGETFDDEVARSDARRNRAVPFSRR